MAIDVVGHFGTTFSYATVASKVARALKKLGHLGSVTNLDPKVHPMHRGLVGQPAPKGTHVFVVSVPDETLEVYPATYGRDQSAIFISPNTDEMEKARARMVAMFGLAVAPSEWCATVVDRCVHELGLSVETVVCPLGVEQHLFDSRHERIEALEARLTSGERPRVLHLSTDQMWPSRKGTEAFLNAWSMGEFDQVADLRVHVPPAIVQSVHEYMRELGTGVEAVVQAGETYGDEGDLFGLIDWADLIVAPSRCEGFGIMLASSLVGGVPLLCTYVTGQVDFLRRLPGWMGIPSEWIQMPMAGEPGAAPWVFPPVFASHLGYALSPDVRRSMLSGLLHDADWAKYTWAHSSKKFVETLAHWAVREK